MMSTRTVQIPRLPWPLTSAVICGGAALVAGAAATSRHVLWYLAAAALGVAWMALGRHRVSVLPPAMLLLVMDGIVGLNLSSYASPGSFKPVDVCVLGLVALGSVRLLIDGFQRRTTVDGWLWVWSAALVTVWSASVLRAVGDGVPLLRAALFGRDFLYFALLLPVAPALFPSMATLRRFMAITTGLTTIYASAYLLAAVGALPPSLVNAYQTATYGPVTRLYATMVDLMVLVFTLALSRALITHGRSARVSTAVAVITGCAVVIGLTRALYAGLLVGFVVALAVWGSGAGRPAAIVRRRLLVTLVGLFLVGTVAAVASPKLFTSSSSPVHAIEQRFTSGISDATSGASNNFTYRLTVDNRMLAHLGGQWFLGLGFLHNQYVYFADLPDGSIRNADTGLFNGLMTMGIAGTILIYLPVLGLLALAASKSRRHTAWSWYWFGLTFWLVLVLVTSFTLGALFTSTGLAMIAVAIGASVRLAWLEDRTREAVRPRAIGIRANATEALATAD